MVSEITWIGTVHEDMVRRGAFIAARIRAGTNHQELRREIAHRHAVERFPEKTVEEIADLVNQGKFGISQASLTFHKIAWELLSDAGFDTGDTELYVSAHRLAQQSTVALRDILIEDLRSMPNSLQREHFLTEAQTIYRLGRSRSNRQQ